MTSDLRNGWDHLIASDESRHTHTDASWLKDKVLTGGMRPYGATQQYSNCFELY